MTRSPPTCVLADSIPRVRKEHSSHKQPAACLHLSGEGGGNCCAAQGFCEVLLGRATTSESVSTGPRSIIVSTSVTHLLLSCALSLHSHHTPATSPWLPVVREALPSRARGGSCACPTTPEKQGWDATSSARGGNGSNVCLDVLHRKCLSLFQSTPSQILSCNSVSTSSHLVLWCFPQRHLCFNHVFEHVVVVCFA